MPADRHACPDCGASHARRKPKKTTPRGAHLESTDLTPAKCPRCASPVIAGRVQGLDVYLDPRRLNHIGASCFTALPARGPIVVIRGLRGRHRNPTQAWPPADGTTWHATHDCDKPVPAELGEPTGRPRPVAPPSDPTNPPY